MKKIKYRLLSYVLILLVSFSVLSFGFGPVPGVKALSHVTVTLSDYTPLKSNVEYTIRFTTGDNGKLNTGNIIYLHFQEKSGGDWVYNTQTVPNSIDPGTIKVNGVPASGITPNPPTGFVSFNVPDGVPADLSHVVIDITTAAGFSNPSEGTYAVSVNTNKESTPVPSNEYEISPPKLSSVTVSVNPSLVNAVAEYDLHFTTSEFGALTAGSDLIEVKFPSGFHLPSSIPASTIEVKANGITKTVDSAITPAMGNTVSFTVPAGLNIGYSANVEVIFPKECGIKNPEDTGDYTLTVATKESTGDYIDSPTESAEFTITASSVSDVTLSVAPAQVKSAASIQISFKSSDVGVLTAGSGKIYIKFPENSSFFVPQIIDESYIKVNGVAASSVDVSGFLVEIVVAQSVSSNSNVSVNIDADAGFKSPETPGSYKIQLWTSSDPTPVESNEVDISTSKISKPTVTVTPAVANMPAMYVVTFITGSAGDLQQGQKVYITFPSSTFVPSNIPLSAVTINGASPSSVDISNKTVAVATPLTILSGSTVAVIFTAGSGIKNPGAPGNYTLKVHTDKETQDIDSSTYTINKGVTTSLSITPSEPDGSNGYYNIVPKVKILVNNPSNLSYVVYYRWDDGEFTTYNNETFEVPEGVHTLYYYAVDQYKNKETMHSKKFLVDSIKPTLTITSPPSGTTLYSPSVVINGVTEKGVQLTVKVKNNTQPVTVQSDGKFEFDYTFTSNGSYSFIFDAVDAAGNKTETILSLKFISQKRIMLKVGSKESYVNDQKLVLDAEPFILNGRVMVPIRFISESLGANVEWDPIFKIVKITMPNGEFVRLQVGNKTADLNGKAVSLDAPPVIKNNRVFVPIRFVAESFSAEVDWDPEYRIVRIIYPKP